MGDNGDVVIALAGNPNVGKSTVFNALTGLRQHTGNWAGKTVDSARGSYRFEDRRFICLDVPGAYSLMPRSHEEALARDCLCFSGADVVAVVCDGTSLVRNMNLVLQCIELAPRAVVCVNLLDEAEKKGLHIDLALLEKRLGVPVAGTSARAGKGLDTLMKRVCAALMTEAPAAPVSYPAPVEQAVSLLEPHLAPLLSGRLKTRWTALRLLENDKSFLQTLDLHLCTPLLSDPALRAALNDAQKLLQAAGLADRLSDVLVESVYARAERLLDGVVGARTRSVSRVRSRVDHLLTSRATGVPLMLLLLCLVFYITILGANVPSGLLMRLLFAPEDFFYHGLLSLGAPLWLAGALIRGAYRVLAWVVSVMLPPMAIFFPLFTLLEDLGYLPRVAFNLDRRFLRCGACGKQALTMWVVDNGMRENANATRRAAVEAESPVRGIRISASIHRHFNINSFRAVARASIDERLFGFKARLCSLGSVLATDNLGDSYEVVDKSFYHCYNVNRCSIENITVVLHEARTIERQLNIPTDLRCIAACVMAARHNTPVGFPAVLYDRPLWCACS